ncbi:MAG: RNA 2'-phosphotransferase [bacterium]|nr:RNA 2'-phosphotransferase [bacterium]
MDLKKYSKLLSYVLRHAPESIGLEIDAQGWAKVEDLLVRIREQKFPEFDRALLHKVVSENDKQRFQFDADRARLRAAQGHSVQVDLGLAPLAPPEVLYHGTVERFLESILSAGLKPGSRTHVHLSAEVETARTVGARRGRPVLLKIRAGEMHGQGHAFYLSENGVWLTAAVPPEFIES